MKQRNPNAKCGNCPYWKRTAMGWWDDGLLFGWCRYWPSKIKKRDTEWCGQHPDFWTHTPKKIVIGPEIVNCDYVPTKCESCNRQLSVTTDKDSPCYTCGHDFKNYKPFDDPGAMQALAEMDRKEADT